MSYVIDKSAIVTGGGSGIGKAICIELLKHGVQKLAIIDLKFEKFEEFKLDHSNKELTFHKVDVSNKNQIETTYKQIKEDFGQIHILVNSAGIFNDANVAFSIDVNLTGLINSSLIGFSLMNKQNGGEGGYILNIASVFGLSPLPQSPIYNATKFAIVGFTRSMGTDVYFENTGVKFMSICPGYTRTNLGASPDYQPMFPFLNEGLYKFLAAQIIQEADVVGRCAIIAIEADKNGSVWVSNESENYELNITDPIDIYKNDLNSN